MEEIAHSPDQTVLTFKSNSVIGVTPSLYMTTTSIIARLQIEGIHRWQNCPIEEVSYLRDYHRHVFHIIGKAYVKHSDRDIEFIQLTHEIRRYLLSKYYTQKYSCCFFDNNSCEMLAHELSHQFDLYECEVNEDGESGAIVQRGPVKV